MSTLRNGRFASRAAALRTRGTRGRGHPCQAGFSARFSALALVVMAMGVAPGYAAPPQACFAPDSLPVRAGDPSPVKGNHAFDRSDAAHTLAPFAPVPTHLRGAIRRVEVPKGQKLIALTFDLCEQPGEIAGYDGAIIDYLRAEGIKATLFVGGKWMKSHDERARQLIADPLFEIANHGWAHRNLRLIAGDALRQEIEGPQRAYEMARSKLAAAQCLPPGAGSSSRPAPARMGLFRFPYGACNQAALDAVNDAGLLAIQWDLSTGDPSPSQGAQAIAETIVRQARPGSIVIAHANGRGFHTAAALPLAIPKLRAAGYRFVTVGELLAAGRPVVEPRCYDSRPGDTDRYDHPLGLAVGKRPGGAPARSAAAAETTEILPWAAAAAPAGRAQPQQPPPRRRVTDPQRPAASPQAAAQPQPEPVKQPASSGWFKWPWQ